jgi:alcohol dehydrogenase class IV
MPGEAFSFAAPTRIEFGTGRFAEIGPTLAALGRRAFVVTNADRTGRHGIMARLEASAADAGVALDVHWIRGEPEVGGVDAAVRAALAAGADVVVGLGGGSAIDTAKAVAGLLTNGGGCLDYLEVVGAGRALSEPAAPWVAVPTTGGTGAEATRNAVVGSRAHGTKASLRSPHLLARVALVDPELAVSLPREVTARCGMDALVQCIESYTSRGANALTDALAREGIARAAWAVRRAFTYGEDLAARADLALAALISGITLAHAGLGAVHGLAAPLGARFPIPHGSACAALLPHVMRANVEALRAADARHPWLARYAEVGRLIAGEAAIEAGIAAAEELVSDLRIPPLAAAGVVESSIPELITLARGASSMRHNPVELDAQHLAHVLRTAL